MPVGRTSNFIEGFKSFESSDSDNINTQIKNIDYFADTNDAEEIIVNGSKNIKIKCSQNNKDMSNNMTKDMSNNMTKDMSNNMTKDMSNNMTKDMSKNNYMSDRDVEKGKNNSTIKKEKNNASDEPMTTRYRTTKMFDNSEKFNDIDNNSDNDSDSDDSDSIMLADDTDKYKEIKPTEPDNELIIEGFSGSMIGGSSQLRKILIAILIVFVAYLLNHNKSLALLTKLIQNFSKNKEIVNGIILFFIIWIIINIF
jgi:hypothetical protein